MTVAMNPFQISPRTDFSVSKAPVQAEPVTLDNLLARYMPLPEQGLFLGVASDGLPVLLNLDDPRPGPLLVLGDRQTGKTEFLRGVSRAAVMTFSPEAIQFVTVTAHPEAWSDLETLPHCLGIFGLDDEGLAGMFDELSNLRGDGRPRTILLLVDDIASLMSRGDIESERVKLILKNGPAQHIWPVVTLDAGKSAEFADTLSAFHTRIFTRIEDLQLADQLTGMPGANLKSLNNGNQYCIRERNHWLRFWLPSTKEETL
jgi:hypothetical protein